MSCYHDTCKKKPSFNAKGGKAIACKDHKTDGMINVKLTICEEPSCTIAAVYGYAGSTPQYCLKHKIADMTNINRAKLCEYAGCQTRASCNIAGLPAAFCSIHKTDNMTNVVNKRCAYPNCMSLSRLFNYKGSQGEFCVMHKKPGMVDVRHKTCEHAECTLQPSYDIKGGRGRFCASHKLVDMIDVKNKYCEYSGCTIVNPIFNIKGSVSGKFCIQHKTPSMIDVKHKTCEHVNCNVRPSFDVKGGNGRFCGTHKQTDMVDITHTYCEHTDCKKRATFDIAGGKGRWCTKHKTAEMVDVSNKHCIVDKCYSRANFGKLGSKVSHCAVHREKGMIRRSNRKCSECKELAIWGVQFIPLHCELHKKEDEQNLVERPCRSCQLPYMLDKDDTCENCSPGAWKSALLAKQKLLMNYLDSRDLSGEMTDRIIDKGICGKERPDRLYDFHDKIVILECDEHQHNDRACVCEQTRMINISQMFGGIPVYFIRFNPDTYTPKRDALSEDNLTKRYKTCGDFIKDIKDQRMKLPIALLSVIYLYYNGWSGLHEEEWNIITPME